VLTRDSNEFIAIREDLLLRIMGIVEKSGQPVSLSRRRPCIFRAIPVLDKEENRGPAEQQVQQWRDQTQTALSGLLRLKTSRPFATRIAYPPPESAVGGKSQLVESGPLLR